MGHGSNVHLETSKLRQELCSALKVKRLSKREEPLHMVLVGLQYDGALCFVVIAPGIVNYCCSSPLVRLEPDCLQPLPSISYYALPSCYASIYPWLLFAPFILKLILVQ